MRTKTMLISALLGALGSVSVMAQSNVYSLNTVGYVNVTIPSGYSIVTCPLICSPDNTLNTLLPNTNGQYVVPGQAHIFVYAYNNGVGYASSVEETVGTGVNASGWSGGGADVTVMPGVAVFVYSTFSSNVTATFVGQVPTASNYNMTNTLVPGYNLTGSILPFVGDLVSTNSNGTNFTVAFTTPGLHDFVYPYVNGTGFISYEYTPGLGGWTTNDVVADPTTTTVTEGFFYFNNSSSTTNSSWVQSYTP
jgi:hypothetical protein